MKPNKKKLKPLRHPAGPEGRSGGRSGGPRAQRGASEVSIFFLLGFMNTTQGFQFYPAKISVNTTETIKNINEYQVTK